MIKRIKLEDTDYSKIRDITGKYSELESRFTSIQKELEILQEKQVEITQQLESLQEREREFFDDVKTRFGDGKLDLFTFEYCVEQ